MDVSKAKIDFCIIQQDNPASKQFGVINNNSKGIVQFIRQVHKIAKTKTVLFCLENTGVYSMPVCYWLQQHKSFYWVVPALEVKRSKGITRGKSDKTDAKDIAYYALTHLHDINLSQLPENDFLELRLLLAEREKIIKSLNVFGNTAESQNFLPEKVLKSVLKHNHKTIAFLTKQLNAIDNLINQLIDKNPIFKQQDALLQSIPGIGRQTSIMLIAYTQAFSLFKNHRQFACYCGIAPFEYSSGTSIKQRTKVSHLANKKLKTILNMAALAAKKHDPEINLYFNRKVAEGKNKMLVMNAIRCKIVSRAFAVINRNSKFVNTLKAVA